MPAATDSAVGSGIEGSQSTSLLRNGLFNVVGQVVRGIVAVLTIPFLIRFLGIREYGVWSLAYAVFGLMIMSEAGISVAAAVFLSKDLVRGDSREIGRTLTFVLTSAALLAIALTLFLWNAGPLIGQSLIAFGSADRAVREGGTVLLRRKANCDGSLR